jgi:hypothetical protein
MADIYAAAFAEWHRRWVEQPRKFMIEIETFRMPDEDYGTACARYFRKLKKEIKASRKADK